MMNPLQRLSYTSGHFLFVLDGAPTTAWLKSVDGGTVKGSIVTENVGVDAVQIKHLSTVEIDPLSLELAMSASSPIFGWIQDSWKRKFNRRNGAVIHANFDFRSELTQTFMNALITETTFPALDADDTKPAYLSVKLQPEHLELAATDGAPIVGLEGRGKEKLWAPSMFSIEIDGINCTHVSKIDAITVKQSVKRMYLGNNRYPEIEPTGIEFPNITLTLSAAHAHDFIEWHRAMVVHGDKELKQERQGIIEFLDPEGGNLPLFTIQLHNVGIASLGIEKSQANDDSIKRCKVELYVDSLDLLFGLGLE